MSYDHRIVDDYVKTPNCFSFFISFRTKTGARALAHGEFPSQEERDEAMVRALLDGGYDLPKWWQFWREDRAKLPDRILRRIANK